MKSMLRFAGKNGPWIVISGVVLGLLVPALAGAARPFLSVAIFLFTFGSFLKVNTTTFRDDLKQLNRNALIVLWANLGVPILVFLGVLAFRPDHDLAQGLLFWALVPSSPACVAFAAMLNLNTSITLMATVVGTAAAPFYIPALAAVFGGYRLSIDPLQTSMHLLALIGGAACCAALVKRFARQFVAENPEAMIGIAVVAMFLAGLGSMRGMQAHILADPWLNAGYVALAYAMLFGFETIGTLLFWRFGRTVAFTAGLVSGTRTITLAWVILGDKVLPLADVFLAASMIAKYTAPGFTKALIGQLFRAKAGSTAVPPVGSLAPSDGKLSRT